MIEAVADRFEGAPRQLRRRWSDDFKARAVAEALEPGSSVSAIARRLDIHPSQLFSWRRAALGPHKKSIGSSGHQAVTPSAGVAIIEVLIGDVVVRAPVDADEAHLQRVIRAVRSA
ncbi:transposase [Peteryoungia desertarenae]|nr:transposase [Peteryoungia desertarenae]